MHRAPKNFAKFLGALYTRLMSRTGALILLGVLTILIPFSGLPGSFRTTLTIFFGVVILSIGLSLRSREVIRSEGEVE